MSLFSPIRMYGGEPFDARRWNKNLKLIEDCLNGLEARNFKDQGLDDADFDTALLKRTEVSSNGGPNKIVEHNEFGDLSFNTFDGTNLVSLQLNASNRIEANFPDLQLDFYISGVLETSVTLGGWT